MNAGFFDILDHTQFPKDLMELAAMGEARVRHLLYATFGISYHHFTNRIGSLFQKLIG